MKVILIGYMASGKSTIGKHLASKMLLPFIDLDDYIEAQEKTTISDIFKIKGEVYFRLKENEYLQKLLNSSNKFILSLGGGTPCYANNMELITHNINTTSFYLKASIITLVNRLKLEKEHRPLVKDLSDDDMMEFVAKHVFERQYFYNKSNIKLDINDKSIEDIVLEIENNLN